MEEGRGEWIESKVTTFNGKKQREITCTDHRRIRCHASICQETRWKDMQCARYGTIAIHYCGASGGRGCRVCIQEFHLPAKKAPEDLFNSVSGPGRWPFQMDLDQGFFD